MAQRNPRAADELVTPELARKELERQADEQDVKPINNLDMLRAHLQGHLLLISPMTRAELG